jgi:serine/threonine protein kinase
LEEISQGGEAVVFEEIIAGIQVAVRVQCFDSALFTGDMEEYSFNWHLSTGDFFRVCQSNRFSDFRIAKNFEYEDIGVIPHHENVIAHHANCEIVEEGEIVGWITVMEFAHTDLRKLLTDKVKPAIDVRKIIAKGVKRGENYLAGVGIIHYDMKPENVLLINGIPKLTDFGLVVAGKSNGRESFRKMGYARRGSKYENETYLGKFSVINTVVLEIPGTEIPCNFS